MLKLPSVQRLLSGFIVVIKRFPLEILASIIGTATAMILLETEDEYTFEQTQVLTRILLCSILALTLLLSASVFAEQQKLPLGKSILMKLACVGVVIGVFFFLYPIDNVSNIFRYGFLFAAFHLLVSFAPFIRTNNMSAFWEYNKRLFLRILTAGLYSSVLYAGLSIALVSTDVLFNLDLNEKIYAHLGFFIFGIFNTAFFLAGVPESWNELEEQQSYPKGLKVFTQYVLIPLALVYLGILLSYEGKVIIEWSLPKGVVSSLVLGYAVYGILSILLIHPIRHNEENKWIKTFSRLFYFLLIPLIVLLGIAIWARTQQYGVTESRYIIITLSLWLTGITIYFLVSKAQNIKVIPVSLCLLALLSTWGPQSASSISLNSQLSRLVNFFSEKNSMKDGKFMPLSKTEKSEDGYEIVDFIVERYGAKPLERYLSVNLDSLLLPADTIQVSYSHSYKRFQIIKDYLGLRYNDDDILAPVWYTYEPEKDSISIPINGFSTMHPVNIYEYYEDSTFHWDPDHLTIALIRNQQAHYFELMSVMDSIKAASGEPAGGMYVDDKGKKARLAIYYLSFSQSDSSQIDLESLRGVLLLKE